MNFTQTSLPRANAQESERTYLFGLEADGLEAGAGDVSATGELCQAAYRPNHNKTWILVTDPHPCHTLRPSFSIADLIYAKS